MNPEEIVASAGGKLLQSKIYYEALPIIEELRCDKCQIGTMQGIAFVGQKETGEPVILHSCNNCKEEIQLTERYPKVIHKKGKKIGETSQEVEKFVSEKSSKDGSTNSKVIK